MTNYLYLRENGKPIACIAYQLSEHDIRYGISICSKKDNFKKSLGRRIATNRLTYLPAILKVSGIDKKRAVTRILNEITDWEMPGINCNYGDGISPAAARTVRLAENLLEERNGILS